MTNKKLKMAAMSVALTACVAASPLAANADAPEAAPEKKEPVAEETKKEENTAEPQVNQEAQDAQKTLKDAEVKYNKDNPTTNPDGSQKLDGVIVTNPEGSGETDPDPNPNPDSGETDPDPNPNPDSGETNPNPDPNPNPGSGETNPNPNPDSGETNPNPNPNPDSGETNPNPNPNPDSGETNPNPNPGSGETAPEEKKSEEKKPEEKEPEEKKPEQIGTAEKTEKSETNVETKPNPGAEPIVDTTTPPTVEKNPDGSTTITQPTLTPGKETTTTTGSGTATGDLDTVVTETPKEKIDLEKELGKVNPDISWDVAKDADVGNGYTVQEVKNDETGNQQTLVLRKEETKTAEMTAEDIAKLVDAEKPTVNPDGTYTLTRTETILDAEGNPQTRTTYITIQGSKVTTKTTTELTITREKIEHNEEASIPTDVVLPEVELSNGESLPYTKLDEMLQKKGGKDASGVKDGTYTYTETAEDGTVREYTIKIDTTSTDQLTNAEIVAKLNNDRYSVEGGDIYYRADNGERVKLTVDQNTALRRNLSIDVSVTETKKGTTEAPDKETAENEVKMNAANDAVKNALMQMGLNETEALEALNVGTLNTADHTFTATYKGKNYTLNYTAPTTSEDPSKVTDLPNEPGKTTDTKEHTVTGTAYVTGSTITYQAGAEYKTTGVDTLGMGADFKTAPKDADPDSIQKDTAGRITSYKDKQGNIHSFTYEENVDLNALTPEEKAALEAAANANKPGWTTENLTASLTRVSWKVMSPETTEPKTEKIENGETVNLVKENDWSQTDNNGTFDFTHSGTIYDGMKLVNTAEDGKTKTETYKKTDDNNNVTIITVTTRQLGEEEIRAKFNEKFGSDLIDLNFKDQIVTYTGKDGKTYKAKYQDKVEELTVEVQKPQAVAATGSTEDEAKTAFLKNLEKARQEAEDADETLVIEYEENGEVKYKPVTKETKWEDISHLVGNVVNYNAMTNAELVEYLKKLETTAKKDGKYYDGSTKGDTPYYWDANNEMMKRVPKGVEVETEYQYVLGFIPVEKHYAMINGARHEVHYNDNDIEHLDLATDSKPTLSEKTEDDKPQTTDCVLVNPKLEWNYSAENLLADQNALAPKNRNKNVGLDNKISYDKSGHYEYERGKNKHPDKSAFYKVTGTVAYDAVKENGKVKLFTYQEEAVKAYLTAVEYGKTYEQLNEKEKQEILSTYVVQLGPTRNNSSSPRGYHVYKKSSTMTAYGYMSDDNNTCGNALFEPGSKYNYVGGYDLTLGNLTQTDEKHVVAMGKNTTALSATFMRTKKLPPLTNKELNYIPISKEWVEVTPSKELRKGTDLSGSYQANYTKTEDYRDEQQKGIEGTGEGHYKSFTNLIRNIFKGEDTGTVEGGFIKYEYHTEKNKDGTPVKFEADKMVVTTKQDAEVHYTFTSQESRDVWIKGYTQTVVPPVNPGPDAPELPPVEDAKPAPAPAPAPEAPVLPVVQDARPDPAPAPAPAPAPETPVLPAVQDAKLIQTGTSGWLADLMLGAGMVLSAAGYWMERKRKAMFYKSQH